tara:strand:+ start:25389 stop:25670 length:282 start_codon:yes stop_codon:yes gene_type:complete
MIIFDYIDRQHTPNFQTKEEATAFASQWPIVRSWETPILGGPDGDSHYGYCYFACEGDAADWEEQQVEYLTIKRSTAKVLQDEGNMFGEWTVA